MTPEQYRGTTETYSTTMVAEICCACGVPFLIPVNYQKRLIETHRSFYCPNGHSQSYIAETEADELKKKLHQKENELVQASAAKVQLESQLNQANSKLSKVAKGQCPCCDKTYKHLANHMSKKHPEFKK